MDCAGHFLQNLLQTVQIFQPENSKILIATENIIYLGRPKRMKEVLLENYGISEFSSLLKV
jgi:hypothetical protein